MNISTAINSGFNTAKQSAHGMWLYLVGAVSIVLLVGGLFCLTSPPFKELQKAYDESRQTAQKKEFRAQRAAGALRTRNAPGLTSVRPLPSAVSSRTNKSDPFTRNPLIRIWFFRWWPALLSLAFFAMLSTGYLYSWKVNYLVCRSSGKEFLFRGSFREAMLLMNEYVKATFMSVGACLMILIVLGGLCAFFFWMLPKVLAGLLTFLFITAGILGFVWFSLLLTFWYPAIAYEKKGVLAGAWSSFTAAKSRIFPLIGFYLVLGLIRIGVSLVLRVLGLVFGFAGGFLHLPAMILVATVSGIGYLVGIFMTFFVNASDIHYYLGVRGQNSESI